MADGIGHRAGPSTPAAYFVLLVGAVLATSVLVFFSLGFHPVNRAETIEARQAECSTAFDAHAAELARDGTLDEPGQQEALTAELRSCMRPVYATPLAAVGAGLGLLMVVALALYLTHSWWIVRRDRSRRLKPHLVPGLTEELAQLSHDIGLARALEWRLVPHGGAPSGQAFGLPGRRRVHLDAGLLVLRATDRPAFRAVVAHELAHLRNRDVDLTYLTISIWRAFLLVAVLPTVLLFATARGGTWRTPLDALTDHARTLCALVALGCSVYLLRNAVLRARERHADAAAASVGGVGTALSAILERLPPPRRWLDRWGTHPLPADRLRAIRDPTSLIRPSHWDLIVTGLPAGVLAANLSPVVGGALGLDPTLGMALLGLLIGAWLGAQLASAVWREAVAGSDARRRFPFWLASVMALSGSFLMGTQVSLTGLLGSDDDAVSTLVAGLLLTIAAVPLAAWADSAARAASAAATGGIESAGTARADGISRPGPVPRWAFPAIVATAALATGTALAIWLPYSRVRFGFSLGWGPRPADGEGWYAALGMLTTADLGPADRLVHNPLTLPALAALSLVPTVVLWSAGHRSAVQRAVLLGLGGGLGAAVVGALLPVVAPTALPVDVRQALPEPAEMGFGAVIDNATIAAGSVLVAVMMAVVVAGRGPGRPALALLAATVATLASTGAIWWVAGPVRCLTGVGLCRGALDVDGMSRTAHWVFVQGLLVAVPLVLAAAVVALRRRMAGGAPAQSDDAPTVTGHPAQWPGRLGLVMLLVVIAVVVWGTRTAAYDLWLRGSLD
ncbi:M48 family metalloprotease [Micromonospora sp. NPDC126480]|uniref:M48 family metalloprotease n=1 Tax=Micromonospora sp. NPDC126480 TaxID=3155312 RepID=UPI00332940D5